MNKCLRKLPPGSHYISLFVAFSVFFLLSTWILYAFFVPHLSHLPVGLASETDMHPHKAVCEDYGCPSYPREIDDEGVLRAIEAEKNDPSASSIYGNQYFGMATRRSNQHLYNQDRAFLFKPYITKQSPEDEQSFLVGIADGHGVEGHIVAAFVAIELPKRLAAKLNSRPCCQPDEWIKQQLNETFYEVNEEAPPNALVGGTTASVSLRIGSKLFVANTGDSRTILANYLGKDQVQIPFLTRFDKPHLPDERARIEALGGKINIPPEHPMGSRVIVYSVSARPPEPIGLAMSRSIGDWEWKLIGVIPEPLIDVVDLSLPTYSMNALLIAASDGLWDMRKPIFYAKLFGESFYGEGRPPLTTAVDAIQKASPPNPKWYRDDMTIVGVKISS